MTFVVGESDESRVRKLSRLEDLVGTGSSVNLTGRNLGNGAKVFKRKTSTNEFEFRSITADNEYVSVIQSDSEIKIDIDITAISAVAGQWSENASTELYPKDNSGAQDVIIGDITSGNADIWLKKEGGAVFNQQNNDSDWRYSSQGNTHLVFYDASTDRIGINQSTPTAKLHITGDADEEQLLAEGLDYQDEPIVKVTGVQDLLGLGDVNMLGMFNKYCAIGVNVDPKDAVPTNPGTTLLHLKGYQYGTSGIGQGGAYAILEGQQGVDGGGSPSWGSALFYIHTETRRATPGYFISDNAYNTSVTSQLTGFRLEIDGGGGFPKKFSNANRNDTLLFNNESGKSIHLGTNPSGGCEIQLTIDSDGRVGINNVSPAAMIDLVGDADQIQLNVKANSTQTSKVAVFETSVGGELLSLTNGGVLRLNDTLNLPTADGSADYIMKTDGAGNLSLVDASTIVSANFSDIVVSNDYTVVIDESFNVVEAA